jgi:hypothetical protein
MRSELERISAEIDEATRCIGDGFQDQAADHLASAAALLEVLVQHTPTRPKSEVDKSLGRIAAA